VPDAIGIASRVMADDLFRLNVESQNLANASTTGYKRELIASRPFVQFLEAGDQQIPVSLPALTSVIDSHQGPLTKTSNPLDVAIEGAGFFEVAGNDGPLYTRQGSFRLDSAGRLVTPSGLAVGGSGGEILLTGNSPTIDRQGNVFEGTQRVGQLKVIRFPKSATLTPLGNGLYQASSAGDVVTDAMQVRQGFLESSNVAVLPEIVNMIGLVRRFESAQRVVQNYDAMLGTAVSKLGEF
jgi:flagellar basal-body rod protein FlgF